MTTEVNLLVVCLGNICRSPMAEGILRARIDASPLAGRIEIDSAGTGTWHIGHPPDPRAIASAQAAGIDISELRSRQVRHDDFRHFDWLLCADRKNLRHVRALAPPATAHRASLLLEWAGMPKPHEVPDPYIGKDQDFEAVRRLLERAADAVVERLRRVAAHVVAVAEPPALGAEHARSYPAWLVQHRR